MEVQLNHIQKNYRTKTVLADINLYAESGTCIGILGCNGSGKSTLLSILAGVLSYNGGEFICDGSDLFKNQKLRSRLVGYVPQGITLIEELSGRDNLLLWYDAKELNSELKDGVLKLLGIQDFVNLPVKKMSGGMKKRLCIGCAVAKRPPILLLDEPTAALDLICKQKISDYLNCYKRSGGILLLTTHDVMELELCDQLYILRNGILEPFVYDGNTQKLIESL